MRDQVALITGASSGIGYASALKFASEGYHVVGVARRLERLNELRDVIQVLPSQHGSFLPLEADVCDSRSLFAAVDKAEDHYGRLDILVANAGVGQRGDLVGSRWEDIEKVLRTNIDGVLHSIRASVPLMRRSGQGGHIIIVSSVAYNMVFPYAATYAATKAFVSSIAHSLRLELESDRIRVTDLLVGRTETEFNEKRLGNPGRSKSGVPTMSANDVANVVFDAVQRNRKTITLRWFDRLLVVGNVLVPDLVGRMALKQYR